MPSVGWLRCRVLAAAAIVVVAVLPRAVRADEPIPGWFDLAVPGGLPTLTALGLAETDRALAIVLLSRTLQEHDETVGLTPAEITGILAATASAASDDGAAKLLAIPVPLDARTWEALLPPSDASLFARLLTDRAALNLAAGLSMTDPSVRALLATDRDLLAWLYQRASGAFVVTARRLRIVEGRMAVPGGNGAEAIWETLAGEAPDRPEAFLRALVTRDAGRLAWYFDTMGGLDAGRLAAAWRGLNRDEARDLYESFRDSDRHWRLNEQPYRRAVVDAWTVVTQIDVADGAVASPLPRQTWNYLFTRVRVGRGQALYALRGAATPVSLAWLARQIVLAPRSERPLRFEMVRVAQRAFAGVAPDQRPDLVVALSEMRDYRELLLTLERMRVTRAETWASATRAARHVSTSAERGRDALVAFQGALALVERLAHVGSVDGDSAGRLVRALSEAVLRDRRVTASVADWIVTSLVAELPRLRRPDAWTRSTAYESVILQALAGPPADAGHAEGSAPPTLDWEGLSYVVDIAAAEHARLLRMRAMLPSPGLDAALASGSAPDLATALVTLVYATALGDPEGPASLSPEVAGRHDFGFTSPPPINDTLPWSAPVEQQGPGPWHVRGSLLGLDLALARLQLRRVSDLQMPPPPTLTLNDLSTLTRTSVLLASGVLSDAERDALALAIARGRERVAAAQSDEQAQALAREAALHAAVIQLMPWLRSHQPDSLADVFSLRGLMWLGEPQLSAAALDRWGVSAEGIDGRRRTAFPRPAPWDDYAGRAEAGQIATQVPDLTLRLVEETARLNLPARLIPSLLAFALEDYWHNVQARFVDDYPELTREAARVSGARIEDYVAALTGDGPLRATTP